MVAYCITYFISFSTKYNTICISKMFPKTYVTIIKKKFLKIDMELIIQCLQLMAHCHSQRSFRCQCNHLSIINEIKDTCLVPCTILTVEGTSTCTLSEVLSTSKTTVLTVILKLMLLQKQVALKCSVMLYYLALAVL